MVLALLLMLASTAVDLTDSTYSIPSHDYRHIATKISSLPAAIDCTFDVRDGGRVRLELLPRDELRNFVLQRDHSPLAVVEESAHGVMNQRVPAKGEYAFLLINSSDRAATVHLHAAVEFAPAGYLDPKRRLIVILISFAVFFTSVSLSARALLKAMRPRGSAR